MSPPTITMELWTASSLGRMSEDCAFEEKQRDEESDGRSAADGDGGALAA